jgi:hypothetical protein
VSFVKNFIFIKIKKNLSRNNPNLERFYAISNSISTIGNLAFQGSSLKEIYIEDNLLTTYNRLAFDAIGSTLEELILVSF